MHYYQFHIGDYRAATAHLSNEEDLAYRRLLDMYYDTESRIPGDTQWVSRRIRMDHETVVTVLFDMFEQDENGFWKHPRVEKEIAKYKALEARNKANGSKGGRPKNPDKPSGLPVESHTEPTGKATNNHKPRTNNQIKKEAQPAVDLPDWLDKETWSALVDMRKRIKKPLTDHAQKLMLGKLERMKQAGHDIKAIMEKTIVNSWLDVYEPKAPVQQVSRNTYESLL